MDVLLRAPIFYVSKETYADPGGEEHVRRAHGCRAIWLDRVWPVNPVATQVPVQARRHELKGFDSYFYALEKQVMHVGPDPLDPGRPYHHNHIVQTYEDLIRLIRTLKHEGASPRANVCRRVRRRYVNGNFGIATRAAWDGTFTEKTTHNVV